LLLSEQEKLTLERRNVVLEDAKHDLLLRREELEHQAREGCGITEEGQLIQGGGTQ
jgi:hypothetical protein